MHLLFHVHELFGELHLALELSTDLFLQLRDLKQVLLFQLLKTQIGSGFIVGHVVIPGG